MSWTLYDILGFLSAATVILSLGGIALQLQTIFQRKKLYTNGELGKQKPTEILSLNRFSCSYFAFFSMFLYALTMQDMNLYIAAPRAIALLLLLVILFEIQRDRRNLKSRMTFAICAVFVVATILFCLSSYRSLLSESGVSQTIVTLSTFVLFQGVIHQVIVIRKTGETGALSKKMYQLFLVKDVSSLLFGFMMGLENGWPVIVMHFLSGAAQIVTLYQFRWAASSSLAASRRAALV